MNDSLNKNKKSAYNSAKEIKSYTNSIYIILKQVWNISKFSLK